MSTPEPEINPTPRRRKRKDGQTGLLSGMVWTTARNVVMAAGDFGTVVVISHLLGPDQIGLAQPAIVTGFFAQMIAQAGIEPAIIQRPELDKDHVSTAFIVSLAIGLFQTLVCYFGARYFALMFGVPDSEPLFRGISIVFGINGVGRIGLGYMTRLHRFDAVAKIELFAATFWWGGSIILAKLGYGAWALVVGTILQALVRAIVTIFNVPPQMPPRFSMAAYKDLMSVAKGFAPAQFLNTAALQLDNLVVGRTLGKTALGNYSRAFNLTGRPAVVIALSLYRVLFPAMSRVQQEGEKLKKLFVASCIVSIIVVPLSFTVSILAPELVVAVLSKKWVEAIGPLQVLALAMFLRTGAEVGGSLLRAIGKVGEQVTPKLLYAVGVVTLAIIGSRWGITGVAEGVFVANAIHYFAITRLCLRHTKMTVPEYLLNQAPAFLIGGICAGVTFGLAIPLRHTHTPHWAVLAIAFFASVGVWLLLCWKLPASVIGADFVNLRDKLTAKVRRRKGRRKAQVE